MYVCMYLSIYLCIYLSTQFYFITQLSISVYRTTPLFICLSLDHIASFYFLSFISTLMLLLYLLIHFLPLSIDYPTCFECYRSSLNKANQSPVSVWTTESDNDIRSPQSFDNTTYDSPGSRTSSNRSDSNDNDSSSSISSYDQSYSNSIKSDDINTSLYSSSSTTPGTPNSVWTTGIEIDYGLSIDIGMKKGFSPYEQ